MLRIVRKLVDDLYRSDYNISCSESKLIFASNNNGFTRSLLFTLCVNVCVCICMHVCGGYTFVICIDKGLHKLAPQTFRPQT